MSQSATLETVSDTLSELSTEVKSSNAAQVRRQVLDWLSEHQYEAQYRRGYQLHCSDTCKWLLDHENYVRWFQSRSSFLWMHGQAGSGKTIATSYLIHHLASSQKFPDFVLGYFYYDASTIESLTPETFFGAILKQFCSELPELPTEVVDSYKRATNRSGTPKQPSLSELKFLLRTFLERQNSAVIVIDGIDESPDYAVVCDFLTSVVQSGQYPLRVFVSSRPEVDLRRRFKQFQQIPVPEFALEEDIGVYIKMRIATDPRLRRMSEKMKQYVELTLRTDSHGMSVTPYASQSALDKLRLTYSRFRWVQCQLDEIARLRTDAALKRALNQLPSSIEGSYSRILHNIAPEDITFAKRTLLWLAHTSTPLALPELAEAVVLEPGFNEVDPDSKLNDPNDILEICGSLVTFNTTSQTARLAHHSVREFLTERLDQRSEFWVPAQISHRVIAEACISYMLMEDFSAGPLFQADFTWTMSNYPLLRYAAQNWPFHVQMSGAEAELLPLISKLMTPHSTPKFLFWLQIVLFDSKHGYVNPSKDLEQARPLYYAASYGLTETVRHLVAVGADLNERAGRFGGTAMHAAVWRERPEILGILLDAQADWTIKDYNGATPAELAIWSGKKSIYKQFGNDQKIDNKLTALIEHVLDNRERALAMSAEEWEIAQQYPADAVDGPLRVMSEFFDKTGVQDKQSHDKITKSPAVILHFPSKPREEYASAREISGGQRFELD